MNILPKKRWHVRTKENIARVKQDEAKFSEEQRQIKYRALLADQEARTEALRRRTSSEVCPSASTSSRTTLLSACSAELITGNKEYEAEKKAEQETKEKSIGLLTYLGQSLVESGGQRPWYDVHPKQLQSTDTSDKKKTKDEWEAKKKARADPLTEMNKINDWFEKRREEKAKEEAKSMQRANACIAAMPTLFPHDILVPKNSANRHPLAEAIAAVKARRQESDVRKSKSCVDVEETGPVTTETHLASSNDKSDAISPFDPPGAVSNAVQLAKQLQVDRLRAERLQRERKERERAALVMAKARGLSQALHDPNEPVVSTNERDLPFNSAFNPELAAVLAERRQRHRDSRKRHYPCD
ncbi:Leukocyte receptor cluster member 1 [Paragonimus heterotremus]|uniref:Leukocyte receptor cluster member 1 n=1 Tax=Paragonimus heterotremus TaxID=100268 RepID=A0A8J4WNJ2_9TREM|nr:Leukocyte receptor cluster member 1 [Paragonimus heterotremus]